MLNQGGTYQYVRYCGKSSYIQPELVPWHSWQDKPSPWCYPNFLGNPSSSIPHEYALPIHLQFY